MAVKIYDRLNFLTTHFKKILVLKNLNIFTSVQTNQAFSQNINFLSTSTIGKLVLTTSFFDIVQMTSGQWVEITSGHFECQDGQVLLCCRMLQSIL